MRTKGAKNKLKSKEYYLSKIEELERIENERQNSQNNTGSASAGDNGNTSAGDDLGSLDDQANQSHSAKTSRFELRRPERQERPAVTPSGHSGSAYECGACGCQFDEPLPACPRCKVGLSWDGE